jgi:hypothetical protein
MINRPMTFTALLAAGLLMAGASYAQAPAGVPSGSTGACKDGSYSTQASKKGACRGHKGVKEWYAADAAPAPAAAAAAPMTTPAPVVAAAPAASAPGSSTGARHPTQFTPPAQAAAGGGAGMVWANGSSKVYHCPGDKWYGKTKSGSYMTEADAKAKGLHGDHGKACTN